MASELVKLTVQLVASHASVSELTPAELVEELKTIYRTLSSMESGQPEAAAASAVPEEASEAVVFKPAVPIEESQQDDHIYCLVCGDRFRTLKAHLRRSHALTPAEYCSRFGLDPKTYSLVSKNYSEQRRKLAIDKGLGAFRKQKKE